MNTQPKHSPLPWFKGEQFRLLKGTIEHGEMHLIGIGNGVQNVGYATVSPSTPQSEAKANADFIVRACNSYYGLLEVLKATGFQHSPCDCDPNWKQGDKCLPCIVRAEIAKAERGME